MSDSRMAERATKADAEDASPFSWLSLYMMAGVLIYFLLYVYLPDPDDD